MKESKNESPTSPILRMGVAVVFLGCAALAIAYAWMEYERAEVRRQKSESGSAEVIKIDKMKPLESIDVSP